MSAEVFVILWEKQDGRCAICRTNLTFTKGDDSVNVDHCHATGHVRGLLCQSCNKGLGFFLDNLDILQRAAEYLANPPIKPA